MSHKFFSSGLTSVKGRGNLYLLILLIIAISLRAVEGSSIRSSRSYKSRSFPQICRERHLQGDSNALPDDLPQCSLPLERFWEGLSLPPAVKHPSFAPPWLNVTLFRMGQEFVEKNAAVTIFCEFVGGILLAYEYTTGRLLLSTNKSYPMRTAIRRNLATFKQVRMWYEHDITENDIVETSVKNVRALHEDVYFQIERRKDLGDDVGRDNVTYKDLPVNTKMWEAMEKDLEGSKIPKEYRDLPPGHLEKVLDSNLINQFYMAGSQFIFVGLPFVIQGLEEVMRVGEEELLGWNHLWAVLAYGLGVHEDFNVGLQPSPNHLREFFVRWKNTYVILGFFHVTHESKVLVEAYLQFGTEVVNTFGLFSPNLMMTIILRDLVGIDTPHMDQLLSFSERALLRGWRGMKALMSYLPTPILPLLNTLARTEMKQLCSQYFGSLAESDYTAARYMYV